MSFHIEFMYNLLSYEDFLGSYGHFNDSVDDVIMVILGSNSRTKRHRTMGLTPFVFSWLYKLFETSAGQFWSLLHFDHWSAKMTISLLFLDFHLVDYSCGLPILRAYRPDTGLYYEMEKAELKVYSRALY